MGEVWGAVRSPEGVSGCMRRLLRSGGDLRFVREGEASKEIAVHSCVVRARLEDGGLLRWLLGGNCVLVPGSVDWDELELWLEELYTGSTAGFQEAFLTKSQRETKGSLILHCYVDPNQQRSVQRSCNRPAENAEPSLNLSDEPRQLAELQKDLHNLLHMDPETSRADIHITLESSDGCKQGIYAHKAILANRSSYFAAMEAVSKNLCSVDDASSSFIDNVIINTERVPLMVAMDAIEFIYTGIASVTPEIVGSVLLIANQWCLDELRSLVLQHLRNQVCGNFQKANGSRAKEISIDIMQVLQLCDAALQYGIADINEEISGLRTDCVSWLSVHRKMCWTLKTFALLPLPIHEEIAKAVMEKTREASCVTLFMDCNQLLATLPAFAWAESSRTLTRDLKERVCKYILNHTAKVIRSQKFQQMMLEDWHRKTGEELRHSLIENLGHDTVVNLVTDLHAIVHQHSDSGLADGQADNSESVLSQLYADAQHYASKHLMAIIRSKKFRALDKVAQEKFMARVEMFAAERSSAHLPNREGSSGSSSFIVLNVNAALAPMRCAKFIK